MTFAPKRFGAKPVGGTDGLRSAKTSLTAQLKNRHYSRRSNDVKIIFKNNCNPRAPLTHKFTTPELPIPVKSNQHPWEKAYVAVLSHPFFAVSAQNGSYEISGLPPGQYTVVAWHEKFGEQRAEVSVGVKERKNLDFSFKLPDN